MAKNLVIVESPAKAKTIKKFLGTGYEVVASNGHVRDLPKSQLGVDIDNDFEPKYITIRGKGDILAMLRKEVKKADKVYLATDPDREGEAISWHLTKALKLEGKPVSRITFNEITKNAVKNSIKQAREIDMDLVDAQQTRRILDRIVGYKISPVLWAKIKSGLSAGRVQSVALKLIADRDREVSEFIPEEYWSLSAVFEGGKKGIPAKYYGKNSERIILSSEEEVNSVLAEIEGKDFVVADLKTGEKRRKAPLPFTTSTLQQEASRALNFSTQKTMRIAQQLYEGVEVKGHGSIGLISYLRTDSTRVSEEADKSARDYIAKNYGENYVTTQDVNRATGKKIQDAHEAIRPTYIDMTPASLKDDLARDQYRLYQLIWKRFMASRMEPAVYKTVNAKLEANGHRFTASSSKLSFDGFMLVYQTEEDKNEQSQGDLSSLSEGNSVKVKEFLPEQHFTQPPAHFTEASLVRTLEELGIGRPSTYAPTITTLLGRHYILKESKNLFVTELGEAVNSIMVSSFESIVDINFTATMESLLDSIETGDVAWKTVVRNFYPDLADAVTEAEKDLEKIVIADEETDVVCELCGRNMVIKYGPHGKFLGCPGFPECRNTKPYYEKTGISCPKCGAELLIKKTKKGRRFFGCSSHPDCDFMSWQKPQ